MLRNTRKLNLIMGLVIVISLIVASSSVLFATDVPMPKVIILGSHELSTGGHRALSLFAEAIEDKFPELTTRVVPNGTDVGRSYMIRMGQVDATTQGSFGAIGLQEGLFDYATTNWGPQPVSYVWMSEHPGMGFITRNPDIKTPADMKGATIAAWPGSTNAQSLNEGAAAFFGYDYMTDLKPVEYASTTAAYRDCIQGQLDLTFINVTSSIAYEGASLPGGLHYFEFDPDDKEAWERLESISWGSGPKLSTFGGGISKENPVQTFTDGYPDLVSYNNLEENKAYWISKVIHESFEQAVAKDENMAPLWGLDKFLTLWEIDRLPIHKGTVQYLKEIGRWSDEYEAINNERFERQEKLMVLWEETMEEIVDKKIKAAEVSKYWDQKREAAGLAFDGGIQYTK